MQQRNTRRLGAVAALGALALVAACGGNGGNGDGDGVTDMLLWHGYTEADGEVLDQIVENFNNAQDQCQVNAEAIAWASITEKLITSLGAGNGPNLVVQGPDTSLGYVNQGAFQDVQAYYDDPDTYTSVSALFPNHIETVTWDGKTYGIPMGTAPFAVYYNTELWDAAGLTDDDIPTTVDELLEVAATLTEGDIYGLAAPDDDAGFLSTLLHSGGGDYITDGEVRLDSPENIATLTKWQSAFVDDQISPTGMDATAAMELFGSGRAAMILNGPWEITSAESYGIDVGVFGWPSDWVQGVLNYWWSTNMNDTEAEQQCAYEFGDFWNSMDMQILWQDSYYPPNRTDISEDDFTNPLIQTIAQYSDTAHYYLSGVQQNFNDISSESTTMMQQITQGGDVAELVSTAQTNIEGYLN